MDENNSDYTDHMDWTPEELKIWHEANLIPTELLDPTKCIELHEYMRKNKKTLHDHYHRDFSKDIYQVQIPPHTEWNDAPDIKIIDRRSGEVVQVLEMGADFNLCEGITLKIKAKELNENDEL